MLLLAKSCLIDGWIYIPTKVLNLLNSHIFEKVFHLAYFLPNTHSFIVKLFGREGVFVSRWQGVYESLSRRLAVNF